MGDFQRKESSSRVKYICNRPTKTASSTAAFSLVQHVTDWVGYWCSASWQRWRDSLCLCKYFPSLSPAGPLWWAQTEKCKWWYDSDLKNPSYVYVLHQSTAGNSIYPVLLYHTYIFICWQHKDRSRTWINHTHWGTTESRLYSWWFIDSWWVSDDIYCIKVCVNEPEAAVTEQQAERLLWVICRIRLQKNSYHAQPVKLFCI